MAGTSRDLVCNYTNRRSSHPNQASHTPDLSYPLVYSQCSHLYPPSLSFSSTTLPSSQNTILSNPFLSLHAMIMSWQWVQHTSSTTYTEYSIHRVQHTPSTASTQDCLSSIHSHDYKLTPECRFSFWRAFLYDRPSSASSPCALKGKVTLSHSHVCKSTNRWIESQHSARRPSTGSKYSSNLARLWPPKCISKLAWSRHLSVSPNSLDYSLQVRTIITSQCTSKLARLRPPSASPNSLDHGLQVHP